MKRWDGVADGTRTHDDQNHNLGLYQLSYSHRGEQSEIIASRLQGAAAEAAAVTSADDFTSALKRFFSEAR